MAQAQTVIEAQPPNVGVGRAKLATASPLPRSAAAGPKLPNSSRDGSAVAALKPLEASALAQVPKPRAPAKVERMPAEDIFIAPPRRKRRFVHRAGEYAHMAGAQRLRPLCRLFLWVMGAVVVLLLGASLAKLVDRGEAGAADTASQHSSSD